MKERFLLIVGSILVIFGVIGIIGVGSAYYYVKPHIDALPSDLEQIFSVANQTMNEISFAVEEGVILLRDAADKADFSILWVYRPFGSIDETLRSIASSIENVSGDIQFYSGQIDIIKDSILGQIGILRLIIYGSFVWLACLNVLFIFIGISLLLISYQFTLAHE